MVSGNFFTAVAVFVAVITPSRAECGDHVTLPELEEIFIGRCMDYQTSLHRQSFCPKGSKNCTELWEQFSSSFKDGPQCNITADLFEDFIAAADHEIPGQSLFWSGVGGLAKRLSKNGKDYMTLQDTLTGYLLDGLNFCGGPAGRNESIPCPSENDHNCPHTARLAFWEAASVNFAKKAVGNVYLLLNATRDPLLDDNSDFMRYELPNLREGAVHNFSVILINDSLILWKEQCDENDMTLSKIRTNLTAKHVSFDCIQNPEDLLFTYCTDNLETKVCLSVHFFFSSSAKLSIPLLMMVLSAIIVKFIM